MKTRALDSWAILEWMSGRQPATDRVAKLLSEAVVTVRAESTSEAGLARLKAQLADELARSGITLPE